MTFFTQFGDGKRLEFGYLFDMAGLPQENDLEKLAGSTKFSDFRSHFFLSGSCFKWCNLFSDQDFSD